MSIREAFEQHGYEAEFAFGHKGDQSTYKGAKQQMGSSGLKKTLKNIIKSWPWLYYSLVFRSFFKRQDQLIDALKKGRAYDLVVEFHTVGSRVGAELAKHWGAQYSVIFDSPVDEQFLEMHGTKSALWNRICETEKESMQYASKLMFYSPATRDHVISKYNPSGETNILPSMLHKPLDYKKVEKEGFRIGFIGSFLSWHKIDLMLDVFAKFNAKYPDTRLQLIGYGQMWDDSKAKVQQLGLEDVVDIPGFVSEEDLSTLKSEFTIAVMPGSNWYGSPLKLFEYAQGGIPFVAPVSKTVSSVFEDEKHCFYVKENDEFNSLFEALERYYLHPEEREQMGQNVKAFVESEFGREVYAQKLVQFLGLK